MRLTSRLPVCPKCGGVARPNIFMYGDTTETYVWEEAQKSAKAFREWRKKHLNSRLVILEIGVGAEGMKNHVKEYIKEFANVIFIRINKDEDKSYGEDMYFVQMSAKEALAKILKKR